MNRRYIYFYFGVAIVLIIIYAILFFFVVRGGEQEERSTPTPTPVEVDQQANQRTKPPVKYNEEKVREMMDSLENPQLLSQPDRQARQRILQPLNGKSGYLSQTATYRLEYVLSADQFMAEIRTIDIARAKAEVETWFTSRGVSKEGLCYLPVVFYLNRTTANNLSDTNLLFNPLPEGC